VGKYAPYCSTLHRRRQLQYLYGDWLETKKYEALFFLFLGTTNFWAQSNGAKIAKVSG
jgi:hypothetical protein